MGARAIGLCFLTATLASAQWTDPLLARGWDHFYNVEYPEAIALFQQGVDQKPKDPFRHNYLAEAQLYALMYKAGSLETEFVTGNNPFMRRPKMNPTPEEEERFFASVARSIALSDERLRANPDDLDAMYCKGVALGLRGNYNYLVRKSWIDALRDLTAGRRLHNRISELDPSRVDARMLQGIHDYVVGSLAWGYRMLGFLAGIRGDRAQGVATLQLVARKGNYAKVDAEILLGAIYRRERRPADAIPLVNDLLRRFPRNFLCLFELAQMYADAGDKEKALAALDRIGALPRKVPPEKVAYARGNIQFWYRDYAPAIENLKRATAGAGELDLNTGAYSFLRLGQCYDLTGRRQLALAAYRAAVDYAAESDAGKEARRYLSQPYRRG